MPSKEKPSHSDPLTQLLEAWSSIGRAASLLEFPGQGTTKFDQATTKALDQANIAAKRLKE